MCDKTTWIEIISNSNIWEDAKVYLKNNKKYFEELINNLILECDDYASKNTLLSKKEDFIFSIINGHFDWIIDDLENPEEIEFELSKYDENDIYELYTSYCCIYKKLSTSVNSLNIAPQVKEIFIDYFDAFSNDYCS
jgi:hypothetical protein